jgi:hypothetical protein
MHIAMRAIAAIVCVGFTAYAYAVDCQPGEVVISDENGNPMCSEAIPVQGCAPPSVMVNGNCTVVGHGQDTNDHGGPNSTGGGPGQGTGGSVHHKPDPAEQEAKNIAVKAHHARCEACSHAAQHCTNQAAQVERDCNKDQEAVALARCSETPPDKQMTAWGCTVAQISYVHHYRDKPVYGEKCPNASDEATRLDNWGETPIGPNASNPSNPVTTRYVGPGVDNCVASWAQSHPATEITVSSTSQQSGTTTYSTPGLAHSATDTSGTTYTETSSWDSSTGYTAGCAVLGTKLGSDCGTAEASCKTVNDCGNDD